MTCFFSHPGLLSAFHLSNIPATFHPWTAILLHFCNLSSSFTRPACPNTEKNQEIYPSNFAPSNQPAQPSQPSPCTFPSSTSPPSSPSHLHSSACPNSPSSSPVDQESPKFPLASSAHVSPKHPRPTAPPLLVLRLVDAAPLAAPLPARPRNLFDARRVDGTRLDLGVIVLAEGRGVGGSGV
ncbi:uncharacterized protein BKA78DRAFT_192038 [Phyllosticta capitalensis]|uniref:uncharacterized protein n=1 Tax=Phyllosticta capitalensis TaxID=121624 RepID=UPI00312EA7AD